MVNCTVFGLFVLVSVNPGMAKLLFETFDSRPYMTPTKTPANSICISWNTANLDSTMVAYGLTAALGDTARGTVEEYYHHVLIEGLSPGTTYYYRVLPGGDMKTFRTFAVNADSFCFIAFGDTRTDSASHQSVIDQMANFPFEFLTHSGDLVATGDNTSDWSIFFNTEDTILQSKQFLPAIGNHESPYWPYDTLFALPDSEDYYSVDYANCHFIGLNTSIDLAGQQKTWLVNDLSLASTNPSIDWIFAVFHRPPYSSGTSHGSQLDVQAEWCPVFEQYGVDMVFSGHDHIYERTIPINGVVYIVTGGGGAPLHSVGSNSWTAYAESTYHFCWLKIKGKRLEFYAIKPDGTVFDSLIIEKPVGAAEFVSGETAHLTVKPNPFRRQIEISFRAKHGEESIALGIYDITGSLVRSFALGSAPYALSIIWKGDDDDGRILPPGVYFAVMEGHYQRAVVKIIKEK